MFSLPIICSWKCTLFSVETFLAENILCQKHISSTRNVLLGLVLNIVKLQLENQILSLPQKTDH